MKIWISSPISSPYFSSCSMVNRFIWFSHIVGELGRIDLQGVVHEHVIVFPVGPLVPGDHKLVLVLSEVQPADDPVQLILSLERLLDGAADLVDKVLLEMLDRGPGLLRRFLLVLLQMVALRACSGGFS